MYSAFSARIVGNPSSDANTVWRFTFTRFASVLPVTRAENALS
jgi:hypothetical protein